MSILFKKLKFLFSKFEHFFCLDAVLTAYNLVHKLLIYFSRVALSMSVSNFWQEIMSQIKALVGESEFEFWFSSVQLVSSTDSEITLQVPSSYFSEQLKAKFGDLLEQKFFELLGKNFTLIFEINRTEPNPSKEKKLQKKWHPRLNKDYSFENFVIAGENALAYNASLAIAENLGTIYNPFFIYGGVGLGKTHLMQAIGNSVYGNSQDLNIVYVPAENFVNEFLLRLREKEMPSFKSKYRNVDVLLIDDIHDFQGKKDTQEELFNTFNALFDAKKQMVFTCDRPPMELKNFTDRLLNRLGRGLVVDLQLPSWETRLVILQKKLSSLPKKINIPPLVLELIAKNITSNVRDLEAALFKIFAYSEFVNKEITVSAAEEHLRNFFVGPAQQNIPMDLVMRVVSEYYNTSLQDLKGKKRTQAITSPRQTAMFLIREMTEFSTTEVGLEFGGRDHTTVMHAVQKIEDRLKTEPDFQVTLQNLKRTIKERATKLV